MVFIVSFHVLPKKSGRPDRELAVGHMSPLVGLASNKIERDTWRQRWEDERLKFEVCYLTASWKTLKTAMRNGEGGCIGS